MRRRESGRLAAGLLVAGLLLGVTRLTLGQTTPASPAENDADNGEVSAAHEDEARSLFRAGDAAYADGRFDDALLYFQRSFDLSGRVQLRFNVASALDKLNRFAEAIDEYSAYLEAGPNAENRGYVESRLSILRDAQRPTSNTNERPPGPVDHGSSSSTLVGPVVLMAGGGAALIAALGTGLRAWLIHQELSECPSNMCPEALRSDGRTMDRLAIATRRVGGGWGCCSRRGPALAAPSSDSER